MDENKKIQKKPTKVDFETMTGHTNSGFVFLLEGERLQDILNDTARAFMPIHVIDPDTLEYKVVQYNKHGLINISESDQIQDTTFSKSFYKS